MNRQKLQYLTIQKRKRNLNPSDNEVLKIRFLLNGGIIWVSYFNNIKSQIINSLLNIPLDIYQSKLISLLEKFMISEFIKSNNLHVVKYYE